jgi:TonB family protein
MQSLVVSASLAAAFFLTPAAVGYTPAWSQDADFSITNDAPVAGTPFRRNLMRQLQAWWNVHAFYPKHASNNDEGGTVKIYLSIQPDGKIFSVSLVQSSGSQALDAAGLAAFRTGAVGRFPEGEPGADLDLSLHYVLAHRHDEAVSAGYTPTPYTAPFTIANNPVKSPILETMLQRTCTGTVTRNGGMNQPWRGFRGDVTLVFFRKPDGTPWVKLNETGNLSISPVTQIGNMLQWVGPLERLPGAGSNTAFYTTYTVWPDGPNHLGGAEGSPVPSKSAAYATGLGGPIDLTCGVELPTVPYSNLFAQTQVGPPGDPP